MRPVLIKTLHLLICHLVPWPLNIQTHQTVLLSIRTMTSRFPVSHSNKLFFAAHTEHLRSKQIGGPDYQDAQEGLPPDGPHLAPFQEPNNLHPYGLKCPASHHAELRWIQFPVMHPRQRWTATGGRFLRNFGQLISRPSTIIDQYHSVALCIVPLSRDCLVVRQCLDMLSADALGDFNFTQLLSLHLFSSMSRIL